ADAGAFSSEVLGQEASLNVPTLDGQVRRVRGIVSAARSEGHFGERARGRLRIVPRLWTLSRRRWSRIFQNVDVQKIVGRILDEGAVPCRWGLVKPRPARVYCVQYEETDLEFISRILAEDGIFFCFDQPTDPKEKEVVVFNDSAETYGAIVGNPKLTYR